jgi:hypothetical protein
LGQSGVRGTGEYFGRRTARSDRCNQGPESDRFICEQRLREPLEALAVFAPPRRFAAIGLLDGRVVPDHVAAAF